MSQSSNVLLICHGTLGKSLLCFKPNVLPYVPNLSMMHAGLIFEAKCQKAKEVGKKTKNLKTTKYKQYLHSVPSPWCSLPNRGQGGLLSLPTLRYTFLTGSS